MVLFSKLGLEVKVLYRASDLNTFLSRHSNDGVELTPAEVEAYKKEWFNRLVPADKQEEAMECFCFSRDDYCGYLWHVFSYKILSCLEQGAAKKAFDDFEKKEAVLLENIDSIAFRIKDVSTLKAQDLDTLQDIILTAKDFSWTYIKTHETVCGPYFYTVDLERDLAPETRF